MKHVWTYWGAISGQLKPIRRGGQRSTGWGSQDAYPIRFRLPAWRLERGPNRCFWVRLPSGVALNCWGGGTPEADFKEWLTLVM